MSFKGVPLEIIFTSDHRLEYCPCRGEERFIPEGRACATKGSVIC